MSIAALYDIHGNLPALQAVLDEVRRSGVDEIVVGGDVVPGPMPRETLDCLLDLELPVRFISGNGDRVVRQLMRGQEPAEVPAAFREGIRWNARQLAERHAVTLERWPATLRATVAGVGSVLFCHATPNNDVDVFTMLTPETQLLPIFEAVDADLVVCGHTHMQFDRKVGRIRVVNAGSVGMPFGNPGAYWLLLGPAVELRHTNYDLEAAAQKIRVTKYPGAIDFADRNVLNPPSEEAMLKAYTRH
jgi:putative phosphoesterase